MIFSLEYWLLLVELSSRWSKIDSSLLSFSWISSIVLFNVESIYASRPIIFKLKRRGANDYLCSFLIDHSSPQFMKGEKPSRINNIQIEFISRNIRSLLRDHHFERFQFNSTMKILDQLVNIIPLQIIFAFSYSYQMRTSSNEWTNTRILRSLQMPLSVCPFLCLSACLFVFLFGRFHIAIALAVREMSQSLIETRFLSRWSSTETIFLRLLSKWTEEKV